MRRRFRPSLSRSVSENKGDSNKTTSPNETSAPTRRARIKPKVGIVGNSRSGCAVPRKSQTTPSNEVKRSEAVVPWIVIPLVREKDIIALPKNAAESGMVTDPRSDVNSQDEMHRETTRRAGNIGTLGCTSLELEASALYPQQKDLGGNPVLTQPKENTHIIQSSEVSLEDKSHRETGCTLSELEASALYPQQKDLGGNPVLTQPKENTHIIQSSEVSLEDKSHRETGCTLSELEASALYPQQKDLGGNPVLTQPKENTHIIQSSDVSLEDEPHREAMRDASNNEALGCTLLELEASTTHAQQENIGNPVLTQPKENTHVNIHSSEVCLEDEPNRETTRDTRSNEAIGCTSLDIEVSTTHPQQKDLDDPVLTQPTENTIDIHSSEVLSGESVLQIEPCLAVLLDNESSIQGSATCDDLQSTERSNAVVEEDTQTFTGDIAAVNTTKSHLLDSNINFSQLQNADDLLQSLLQNSNSCSQTHSNSIAGITKVIDDSQRGVLTSSEAATGPHLLMMNDLTVNIVNNNNFEQSSNSQSSSLSDNVITEVMANSSQCDFIRSGGSNLRIPHNQSGNVASHIGGESMRTTPNHSGTSSRLNIKRKRKPRNKFTKLPELDTVLSQSMSIASLDVLDISEIPIASNVEIDLGLCGSKSPEIDHPVLEIPVDLIEDDTSEDCPRKRNAPNVLRQRFGKKNLGTVKLVISRRGVGNAKGTMNNSSQGKDTLCVHVGSETVAEDESGKKEATVIRKKKKVGPNLTQPRRRSNRRGQPEGNPARETSHSGSDLTSSVCDDIGNHNSENVVGGISEGIHAEGGADVTNDVRVPECSQAEDEFNCDYVVGEISECIQAEGGDVVTDEVVRTPECCQAESENCDYVVGEISECIQAEGGDVVTDEVVRTPECCQAESENCDYVVGGISDCHQVEDSLTDVARVPECIEIESQDSITTISSNTLEDISLTIVHGTMAGVLQQNSEPLSTITECPYIDVIACTSSNVTDDIPESEQTPFDNTDSQNNSAAMISTDNTSTVADSCVSEAPAPVNAGSSSIQAKKQQKPKQKGIRKKRKAKGNNADDGSVVQGPEVVQDVAEGPQGVAEGPQGVTEGTQESQDTAPVSDSGVTVGGKKRQSKAKPKIPSKRGRKKAANKESAGNVTEETAATAADKQGTVNPTPSEEAATTSAAPLPENDNSVPQKKKRGRPRSLKKSTDSNKQKDEAEPVARKKTKTRPSSAKTRPSSEPPNVNISTMKISDMAYYNPKTNPMKSPSAEETQENVDNAARISITEETQENIHNAPSTQDNQPEIISPENEEQDEVEDVDGGSQQEDVIAPRVRIDADGNIVLDEESLVIKGAAVANDDAGNREIVFENANQQFRAATKRKYMDRWNKKETLYFYEILSQIGTDFSLMATLFPKRNRTDLKKKFKREEKHNRDLIEKALNQRNPIPASLFAELLEETEEDMERALSVSTPDNVTQA